MLEFKEKGYSRQFLVKNVATITVCLILLLACDEQTTRNRIQTVKTLDSFDQKSSLGYSLSDALSDASTSAPFIWRTIGQGLSYSGVDPELETTIRMTFAYDNSPIEEVTVKCKNEADFSGTMCLSRIDTKTSLQLSTSDGALNEEVQASICAFGAGYFSWSAKLDSQNLGGNLKLNATDGSLLDEFTIEVFGNQEDDNLEGDLVASTKTGEKKTENGREYQGRVFTLGSWPLP